MLIYSASAFTNLLLFSLSDELADTPMWEIFGIPADTLSNLTLFYLLSITSQIDWHAWLTFWSLANTYSRIPVYWFLRQHSKKRQKGKTVTQKKGKNRDKKLYKCGYSSTTRLRWDQLGAELPQFPTPTPHLWFCWEKLLSSILTG